MDSILFIINPISGKGKKDQVVKLILSLFEGSQKVDIAYTQYRNHGFELAQQHCSEYDCIVAVGGDGSVNEIGAALIGTEASLGIIPCGSGNGLARDLGIPLSIKQAILHIKNATNSKKMDTGVVNGKSFLCTAGFGFDAHIAYKFDQSGKRGFINYARLVMQELNAYEPLTYTILHQNEKQLQKGLILTIANAAQFGNGFIISPNSQLFDEKMELICLEKFPVSHYLSIIRKMRSNTLHRSPYFNELSFYKEIRLHCEKPVHYHLDGEPMEPAQHFEIEILPKSLNVIQ